MKKLMLLLLVVLLVGTVSALDIRNIDDVKSYDEKNKTYKLENFFGLGKHIADLELKTPQNNVVPVGYGVVAEIEIRNKEFDYDEVINGIELYNIKDGMKEITRDVDYKYKTIVQIPQYKIVCDKDFAPNGTQIDINCREEPNGFKNEVQWIDFTENSLIKGETITLGIFMEVLPRDYVEWVLNVYGNERLVEWASITASNIVHTDNEGNSTNLQTYNFTGLSFGTADATRILIIGTSGRTGGIGPVTSVDVSGVNATKVVEEVATDNVATLWQVAVPTGTTGYVTVTYDVTVDNSGVGVWALYDSNGTVRDTNSSHGSPTLIQNLDIAGSGSVVGYLYEANGNGATWTGITEDFYQNVDGASRSHSGGSLNFTDDKTGYLINVTISGGNNLINGVVASWYGTTFPGPDVTLNSPADDSISLNETIIFNGTVSSSDTLANVTLFIDGVLNETNSSGINGTDYLFTKVLEFGSHNWTYEACDDVSCTIATTRDFNVSSFIENSQTFNASAFETELQSFTINITTNGTTPLSAELIYNGTTNTGATITSIGGNDFNISQSIDIPLVTGNKSFFFNVTVNGRESSSSAQIQIINNTNYSFCTTPVPYFNVSFKNETLGEELVTAQINADWSFWLGDGTTVKTLTHTNTTENFDYSFCLNDPINRTLETNVTIIYDNSISEQRNFFRGYTLTNVTTNQTLFLLPTADGLFVTFQVVTVAEQIITDVDVNVTKGSDLIETGITDGAGLVTFFLDPDTTYTFTFAKEGFVTVTTSLKPTQTSFTITMGSTVIQEENDTTKGISYIINPLSNTLDNNTEIEFNLTFGSSFWILDVFGFSLKNSTGDVFNTTSSTTDTGGFLSQNLNTGNNTDIIMEIFWTIGGNQTNITRTWLVLDTADEGFSIKTFFDDLSIYLTSGMFGLTNFGLGIIIFGIILLVTGILSARFGNIITNPPGISLIIFSLVLFFDVGLGIMPNPIGAVPNFPTIFVGLIFLGTLLKEAIK